MVHPHFFYSFACASGATSVILGAFGTHALKNRLTPHQFSSWQTATSYQIVHSIALLVASSQPSNSAVQIASYAFTSGITLFSGSIYGLCLTSEGNAWRKLLGPATPIGGAALIIGWLALALSKRGGNNGNATLTHYDLPQDYIASCGCVGHSSYYPTAAINQLAYGSSTSFGPACGLCFHLSLLSTPFAPLPPQGDGIQFTVNGSDSPSITVKVTDLCPASSKEWCSQTSHPITGNKLGSLVHFDLAWPSQAILTSFFPKDSSGEDYGAWWVAYEQVDCRQWSGFQDPSALGSDWQLQDSGCCSPNPSIFGNHPSRPSERYDAQIPVPVQTQQCPSYSNLTNPSLHLSQEQIDASVPNTTNVLSRKDSAASNSSSSISVTKRLLTTMFMLTTFASYMVH